MPKVAQLGFEFGLSVYKVCTFNHCAVSTKTIARESKSWLDQPEMYHSGHCLK